MKTLLMSVMLLFAFTAQAEEVKEREYAVVLHGIFLSSSSMNPIAEALTKAGYEVVNVDYPSTEAPIDELTEKVHEVVKEKVPEDARVHFIGFSTGAIIVRAYLHSHRPKYLGRVVMLAPPNKGSEVADFLKDNMIYEALYGPAGQQLGTKTNAAFTKYGKVNYDLGVIAGDRSIDPVSSAIIPGKDDGKVSIANTKIAGMKDHIVLHAVHTFIVRSKAAQQQTIYFLRNGKFDRRDFTRPNY